MNGLAPLSYQTIDAYVRLADVDLEPHEIDVLMRIDAVLCHPPEPSDG